MALAAWSASRQRSVWSSSLKAPRAYEPTSSTPIGRSRTSRGTTSIEPKRVAFLISCPSRGSLCTSELTTGREPRKQ